MRIENRFTVSLPLEEAWRILLDVERIAPCMPGAELTGVDGDLYEGLVKVKLGAITSQFKGTVRFTRVDEEGHVLELAAQGRETRGQGNASAAVTATLTPAAGGDGTDMTIDTDLSITGKVAQFGRGVMADVSARLLAQFATCLEEDLLRSGAAPPGAAAGDGSAGAERSAAANGAPAAAGAGPRAVESRPAQPVDLLAVAGPSVAARFLPAGLLVAVLAVMAVVRRRGWRWGLAVVGAGLVGALVRAREAG